MLFRIGFESDKDASKSVKGQNKDLKETPKVIREIRDMELPEGLSTGGFFDASIFELGETVDVTGNSKGKGFASTIKRHNMRRGRKTHGGRSYRRIGSIGSMYPQKIFKGKRMAGRLGNEQVTVKKPYNCINRQRTQCNGVKGAFLDQRNHWSQLREVSHERV